MAIWYNDFVDSAVQAQVKYNNSKNKNWWQRTFGKKDGGSKVGNFFRSIFKRRNTDRNSGGRGGILDNIGDNVTTAVNRVFDNIELPKINTRVGLDSRTIFFAILAGLFLFFGINRKKRN
jgi:hypothetical protein